MQLSKESKTPLENFEDVLFQEQQMLFQEITMPRSKLGCQDNAVFILQLGVEFDFNKLQLSPKIPVYLNEIQFCECLLSIIYVNEGAKEIGHGQLFLILVSPYIGLFQVGV